MSRSSSSSSSSCPGGECKGAGSAHGPRTTAGLGSAQPLGLAEPGEQVNERPPALHRGGEEPAHRPRTRHATGGDPEMQGVMIDGDLVISRNKKRDRDGSLVEEI